MAKKLASRSSSTKQPATAKKKAPAKKKAAAKEPAAAKQAKLRRFWMISPADRSDVDCVDDIDNEAALFSVLTFGEPFDGVFPPGYKIWLDRRKPTDLLGGSQSWPLVSDRFAETVKKMADGQVQVYDVPLFDAQTKKPVKGYKLLHIPGSLRAAARVNGKVMSKPSWGIVFDSKKIKPEVHIFRMGEAKSFKIISHELRKALEAVGVGGIEYLETSTI